MADYASGKADWLAHGLPREGESEATTYAGELADRDPPTCALDTRLADVSRLLDGSAYGYCLVVGEQRVVLGRVRRSAIAGAEPTGLAESAMEPGPKTFRANTPAEKLTQRLAELGFRTAVLTTPRGLLIGVFHPERFEHQDAGGSDG